MKSLLLIKTGKFNTCHEVADYLSIHISTLESWLNNYKEGGLQQMLTDKAKNKTSKITAVNIHEGLAKRVNDPNNLFLGYWDAKTR